ncbi:MAG: NfeD family protein [Acidimicrobiia bacterium]|nr:NfeD family protein [Acidimicrobiia bacterium]
MSTDRTVTEIVADCERYWLQTRVPRKTADEMRTELEQHLLEATSEGKSPSTVVGPDIATFAEAWASEQRDRSGQLPSWQDVKSGNSERRRNARYALLAYVLIVAAITALGFVVGKGDEAMDFEVWRWVWTILAVVMLIGEMFTAGFFLLPFGIGAGAAALLAWFETGLAVQWITFFAVSIISLLYVRRFVHHQDDFEPTPVASNRFLHAKAIVLETIDPHAGSGMVRMESEEWRATSDGEVIEAGSEVRVERITGSRLVVARDETT